MSAQFEMALSQQLARLRTLERALHGSGPWLFVVGDGSIIIEAERRLEPERQAVVFSAEMWTELGALYSVELCTPDEIPLSSRVVYLPPGPSRFEWELGLDPVAA